MHVLRGPVQTLRCRMIEMLTRRVPVVFPPTEMIGWKKAKGGRYAPPELLA